MGQLASFWTVAGRELQHSACCKIQLLDGSRSSHLMYAQLEAKIVNLRMDPSYAHVFYWNCECIVAEFDS